MSVLNIDRRMLDELHWDGQGMAYFGAVLFGQYAFGHSHLIHTYIHEDRVPQFSSSNQQNQRRVDVHVNAAGPRNHKSERRQKA